MTGTITSHNNDGLKKYFYDHVDCTILRNDRNKTILRTNHSDNQLFIKIYHYPDFIASRFQHKRFAGGPLEFKLCKKLRHFGVKTPEPVGACVKRNGFGLMQKSLFASRWLNDSVPLSKYLPLLKTETDPSLDRLRALTENLGRFVGYINSKHIISSDFNVSNILVRKKECMEEFYLVDYERIFFKHTYELSNCLLGLSQIGAFLIRLDQCLIHHFCSGYIMAVKDIDLNRLEDILLAASIKKKDQWEMNMDKRFSQIANQLSQNQDES
ncbi:MAG: lipopolysaccharide kinase InaA family protein [Pseudomonadota bacterium]